jgi:hypothetical protein
MDHLSAQREAERALQSAIASENQKLAHNAELLANTAAQFKSMQEAAAKTVLVAESLPYRIQEQIATFTRQLEEQDDVEKTALRQEVESLRENETRKLDTLIGTIRASLAEFSATEKSARESLETARRTAAEAAPTLANSVATALREATQQALNSIAGADTSTRETIAAAQAAADRIAERTAAIQHLGQEIDRNLNDRIAELAAAAQAIENAARTAQSPAGGAAASAPAQTSEQPASPASSSPVETPAATLPPLPFAPPSRPKQDAPPASEQPAIPVAEVAIASAAAPATQPPPAAEPAPAAEPPPKREPRRKSSSRNLNDSVLPGFADPEIIYEPEPANHSAPAKSSDGRTRLLVNAFIGIGNKVYLRGNGPGLSWDKGIPMEFVSIGKWSWETSKAAQPISVQIFKNDDVAAQGETITLPPGHHIEASPVFREPDPF